MSNTYYEKTDIVIDENLIGAETRSAITGAWVDENLEDVSIALKADINTGILPDSWPISEAVAKKIIKMSKADIRTADKKRAARKKRHKKAKMKMLSRRKNR